jgi:hypothetical protein
MVIDYFSRFIWVFPCTTDNSEEVCRSLGWLWSITGSLVAVYSDEGTHFSSTQMQSFFAQKGVLWIPVPVATKKATGMVEKANDIFQRVLKKSKKSGRKWVFEVQSAAFETNCREIRHLGYSPFEIQHRYQPLSAVDFKFRSFNQVQSCLFLTQPWEEVHKALSDETMARKVYEFIEMRGVIQLEVKSNSDLVKVKQKEMHDLGVKHYSFEPGDLVMLYDHRSANKKLHPAYRGPFEISEFGGDYGKSFKLQQLDGTLIPQTFYGDSLKFFKPRTNYLISKSDKDLIQYQNICSRKGKFKPGSG